MHDRSLLTIGIILISSSVSSDGFSQSRQNGEFFTDIGLLPACSEARVRWEKSAYSEFFL